MTTSSTIFNLEQEVSHLKSQLFLQEGGNQAVARYDQVKYQTFDNFTEKQLSFFWRPQEVDLSKDRLDFKSLPSHQQHIFTSNLFRQIMLDSVQGRGPNLVLLPICTNPEFESWIENWGMNESLHSRTYTHIIRNVYSNPSEVFDNIMKVPEIVACATDVSKYYDELHKFNIIKQAAELGIIPTSQYDEYGHKEAIWMCMNSINALEGIRFYNSFACSWNFAEQKIMEGNAKLIRLICRDENLHLGATQYTLKVLPRDDKAYESISKNKKPQVQVLFNKVVEQELEWSKYLFKDGSMMGLNAEILGQYVKFIAAKRMRSVGLEVDFDAPGSDPLPWTKDWISGKDVQVAPQEAEQSSYLISDVNQDIDANVLSSLEL